MYRISPRQSNSEYCKTAAERYIQNLDKDLYSQERFERKFAQYFGYKTTVALNSGTTSLHLSLAALGVTKDDEVICPSFAFAAVANSIKYLGARPLFIDIDLKTLSFNESYLEAVLEQRVKSNNLPRAIIVIHPYGYIVNLKRIKLIARSYNIPIIEDAAGALGSSSVKSNIGSAGEVVIYSFNLNKIISTGGGGIIATNNIDLADKVRHLSNQAKLPGSGYIHDSIGFNSVMHPYASELGYLALDYLKNELHNRKKLFDYFAENLSSTLNFIQFDSFDNPNHWLTPVYHEDIRLNEVKLLFQSLDIEFRTLWNSINCYDFNNDCFYYGSGESEYLYNRGFVLPGNTQIEITRLDSLVSGLKKIYE